ncbi:MAG: TonB family protein [Hyphomicrobium sp.]|uniref:energy transducer TonB family protein n=1 Tax=Hyphomicrobium sp. TaxID=82 RepID=UPI0039E5C1BF
MTAENVGQTAGLSIAGFAPWGAGTSKRERNFYIALACAFILHASFLVSAAQNGGAKRLGAENGADDAISVSLVTEQDLQSRATVADEVSPPPGPIAPTQEQQQAKPQPQQPKEQQPTPPQPEQAKQEPQPPEPQQPPPEPQAQETPQPQDTAQPDVPQDSDPAKPEPEKVAKQEDTSPDSQAPDLFSLDDLDPSKMQSEKEPKAKPKSEPKPEAKKPTTSKSAKKSSSKAQKKVAALDLSTQALAPSLSGGGGAAAFQRPPGITRSGLNDAFARAVIRALQQTMPQLTNTLGRVTVRIFLSENGNVVDVKLLAGSKDPSLNQDVVFAAKQTSYPIPPAGSNEADRTFMVTYIYD